ncbi:UDP-galactose:fucoside alpha-3-galactosyltransferase, partial [Trifolium pratense]
APFPNWLRDEIKKTVIAAHSTDHPKVEQTLVRDGIDKSYVKADDETDSRSIDSSRSAEDEEIATKVLREDDLPAEVGHNVATSNHNASTSPPSAPVAKATAKVLVRDKAKEIENDGANEKSNSSSPGDVLGLGNYGSDADDEIESSTVPAPAKNDAYM